MKALLTFLIALTLAFAGCTSTIQDLKDANDAVKEMEVESAQDGGCERSSSRIQDFRSTFLYCPELKGGKDHRLDLGPCMVGTDETNMWASLSGEVKTGTIKITVKGGNAVLYEETYTVNDGEFFGGVSDEDNHGTYSADIVPSSDFRGEVNVSLSCHAA